MTGVLVSREWLDRYGDRLQEAASKAGMAVEPVLLPDDPDARLTDEECEPIEIGVYSLDMMEGTARSFFSASFRAPNLRWVHLPSAGVDHPAFGRLLAHGLRLTNAAGSTAEPIAQSVIAAMLMLSRDFLHYADAQRRHAWEQLEADDSLPELPDQTLLVYGLGSIGSGVARMAQAIGLHVVGMRRSPQRPEDPVDELHHPDHLRALLPRTDWLAITSPLTPETRGLFNAETLALLPRGAHVMNVGRGPIIDEPALIEALRSEHLGGAYLDVFEEEPLPADSPLWDLPRVIITPHNSGASRGNRDRGAEIFFENLGHWAREEPLRNEVLEAGA